MKQRRRISFFMLLVIGWMLKNVKIGLIIGIVMGLLLTSFVNPSKTSSKGKSD
jgi:uncharacterized membrane-anchored protein YhcB (DUF1043 family)